MNVIVFGGAGFIGNSVVKKLMNAGHLVASVDNLISGSSKNIETTIKNFNIDISSKDSFSKIDFNPDVVIHLAFPTPLCDRKVENQYENIASTGMLNVLEYTKNTCNRIIYASSISVYGIPQKSPITERNKIDPILIYGANKYLDELYIKCYHAQFGLQYNVLRISDTFGEYDKRKNAVNNFLNSFIQNKSILIAGDGEQVRTFTYVEDIANAFLLSLNKFRNTEYNIASNHHISINSLIKELEIIFDKNVVVIYNKDVKDNRDYIFNCDKFKQDFGVFETIGFEKGIKKTIDYLKTIK